MTPSPQAMTALQRARVLAAAAALHEFTVAELHAYSGEDVDVVTSIVEREEAFFAPRGDGTAERHWGIVDRGSLLAAVRDIESVLGIPRKPPPVVTSEQDRVSALLAAEQALLRSWDPDSDPERDVLVETAVLELRAAREGAPATDPISRRATAVEVFARLAEAAYTGQRLATEDLERAAEALLELAESAPDRVHRFLRGLTEIARRGGAVPPFGVVCEDDPNALISGLPKDVDWVKQDLSEVGAPVWAQRWSLALVPRRLLAGLVVQDHYFAQLHRIATWNSPVFVVSQEGGVRFVDNVTQEGAYFLTWASPVARVTAAMSRALEQTPETGVASAGLVLRQSQSERIRSELRDAVAEGHNVRVIAHNHIALLDELLRRDALERGLSYSRLVEQTGIPHTAAELTQSDLAAVIERVAPRPGQVEGDVRVRRDAGFLLALDIGVDHVRAARSDLRAELPPYETARKKELILGEYDAFRGNNKRVHEDVPRALSFAASFLRELLGERSPTDIVGIGLAISHPIEQDGRRPRGMLERDDWDHRAPIEMLRKDLGWECPIYAINDANAGLLSEVRFGALQGQRDAWYVRWTRGIGGGGLVDGRLFTGAHGLAGELGHLPVILVEEHRQPKPKRCKVCGHYCLQSVAGSEVLERQLRKERKRADKLGIPLPELPWSKRYVAEYVGQALAQVTTLFNPEKIAVGGELGEREVDELKSEIKRAMRQHALPPANDQVEVVAGRRTGRAVLEGALVHVLEENGSRHLLMSALNAQPRGAHGGPAGAERLAY